MMQRLETLDEEAARAMLAGNVADLDKLWSPNLLVNAPDNTLKTKDQVLQAVRTSRISYTSFTRRVEHVAVYGDMAITMGSEVVVPAGDRPDAGQEIHRRYTNVWRDEGGRWKLPARHAHIVSPK